MIFAFCLLLKTSYHKENRYMIFKLFLIAIVCFFKSNPQAFATTYYVSSSALGNDTINNGLSSSTPFKTIKKALSRAWTAGDIVYVMSGVYVESVFISQSNITLSAYPGHFPIIDGGDTLPNKDWGALLGIGGNYNNVSGFEVRHSNRKGTFAGGFGVSLLGHHNLVRKMNVHHTWVQGVIVKGDYNTVESSQVWQAALANSLSPGSAGSWPSGMSAARNSSPSALIPGITSYATFRKNKVYNNWGEGLSCFEADHCRVEDNISYDNWTVNFYLSDTTNSIVQRNIIYISSNPAIPTREGRHSGISLADEQAHAPRSINNKIINNFIYNADFNAFAWSGVSGAGLNKVVIANNTIVDGNFKTGYLGSSGIINSESYVINNIILGSSSNIPSNIGIKFFNNNWLVVPAMAASGTNVSGNPLIAKSGATTRGALTPDFFKLLIGSPVINKGKVLGSVPQDFFNTTRGPYPDIGGHEYP